MEAPTIKGMEKARRLFRGRIPKIMETSQKKSNELTIDMEKVETGCFQKDSGLMKISLNIQIQCRPDGQWSVQHASVNASPLNSSPNPHSTTRNSQPSSSRSGPSIQTNEIRPTTFLGPQEKIHLQPTRPTRSWF
jgi:hypothetical protein